MIAGWMGWCGMGWVVRCGIGLPGLKARGGYSLTALTPVRATNAAGAITIPMKTKATKRSGISNSPYAPFALVWRAALKRMMRLIEGKGNGTFTRVGRPKVLFGCYRWGMRAGMGFLVSRSSSKERSMRHRSVSEGNGCVGLSGIAGGGALLSVPLEG